MRIDATHRKWLIASLIIFGVATFIYIAYAASSPAGPSGGSAIGLAFGITGFAFMIFAGLLAARKKVAVWRLGRAQTWMRGHLWLGLLSLPLIFFHAGFQFGGVLTKVLMTLLITVVASGLVGAALQHYMPRMMTSEIPMETIFEQIDHVREQLIVEADALVHAVCGPAQTESVALSGAGGGAVAIATAAPAAVHAAPRFLHPAIAAVPEAPASAQSTAGPARRIVAAFSMRCALYFPPTRRTPPASSKKFAKKSASCGVRFGCITGCMAG